MTSKSFIPVLRELARAYQAFASYSAAHIRTLDLTPSQFDIIATLGNTEGMNFKELGERTLITKGTLTGVVERLQAKRLVQREVSSSDKRSQIVKLTDRGAAIFDQVFPAHLNHVDRVFSEISQNELDEMESVLKRLRHVFTEAGN